MNKKKNGFTLLELVIALAIMGFLFGIAVLRFTVSIRRARDSQRKIHLKEVVTGLQAYYNDFQEFPASITWGSALSGNGVNYVKELPQDPKNGFSYHYEYSGPNAYALEACIEVPTIDDTKDCNFITNCSSGICYRLP